MLPSRRASDIGEQFSKRSWIVGKLADQHKCCLVRSLGTESTVLYLQTEATNVVGSFTDVGCDDAYSTWCVQVLRSPKEAFAAAMQSWRERCEKCICLQGDYVEK